jgi:DNA-binding transcriptional LysR family regulator
MYVFVANIHLLFIPVCLNMAYVLDVRKLRMLAELERLGTVAAVARSLHQTAPGVSMQLATLEREVGLQLTERNGRTLTLTPAGRLLARHGHDIVDMLSLVDMEVDALRDGSVGSYRIAAFPSIARTIVADTWKTVADEPGLGLSLQLLELEPEDSLPALSAGEVELALTHSYSNLPRLPSPGLASVRIASEPVWLAVRSDDAGLADDAPAVLEDYADRDWVAPHRQLSCYEMIQRACGAAGFTPRIVGEATDFSVQLALVSAGAVVALMPQLTIAQLPANVVLRSLVEPVFRHDFVVTRVASQADAGLTRLRGLLAESAERLVPATSELLDR